MATVDVGTLITNQVTAVNQTAAQADGFLANLLLTANVAFSDGFNIDNILPGAYNYASVPQVSVVTAVAGTRPNVSALETVGAPVAPSFNFTPITPITLPADDLLVPSNTFLYAEGAYDRTLLDPWRAKMLSDLLNGGYGIDTNDEIALLNRARDREVELALTRVDDVGRSMAARGFPLPPGEFNIFVDRAWQDMQNKVADMNRDIYIDRAKRFVENRRFTITEVREMEQILIAFYNSVQERAFNVAKQTLEFSIAIFNTLAQRYKYRLEAAIANGQVQLWRSQAEAEQARAYFESFRTQVLAYEANLRRVLETARLQVDAYRTDIDASRVLNDGQIAVATLQQKVIEATVTQNVAISNLAIENAKAKLLATVEGLKFRAGASQYASEKFFGLLTAMQASIGSLAVQTAAT